MIEELSRKNFGLAHQTKSSIFLKDRQTDGQKKQANLGTLRSIFLII